MSDDAPSAPAGQSGCALLSFDFACGAVVVMDGRRILAHNPPPSN
ncbi:hypothetical protein A8924_5228 [Saccharopolyspora erythraea NRRL 2338]|nr:hypothetical protein [Saccharopolyspora erythraea]PFG97778.1 hypothetical protein A8924_5228 [Saccharopolyspora erythraea NRRL 2338]